LRNQQILEDGNRLLAPLEPKVSGRRVRRPDSPHFIDCFSEFSGPTPTRRPLDGKP
jgi:hypothetical protein